MTLDAENTTATMEVAELQTERLLLSSVSSHPQNPRTHSPRQIKELQASLTEHGYAAGSMTVQKSRMRLVKGHGVYEALLGLGCVEADFVVVDMDDAEALLFLARDNRLSDLSVFDVPKLKAITVELQKIDVPLERIGFNEEELKSLESDWAKSEADNRVIEKDDPPEQAESSEKTTYEVVITVTDADRQAKLHKTLVKQGEVCRMSTVLRRSGNKQAQRMFPELAKCCMCEATEDLQRHHADGNTSNNSMDNIQVLCRTHHAWQHTKAKATA